MLIVVDDSFSTMETCKGDRSFCMVGTAQHRNLVGGESDIFGEPIECRLRVDYSNQALHEADHRRFDRRDERAAKLLCASLIDKGRALQRQVMDCI